MKFVILVTVLLLVDVLYSVPSNCNENQRQVLSIDEFDTMDVDTYTFGSNHETLSDEDCKDKNICVIDCSHIVKGCTSKQKLEVIHGTNSNIDDAYVKTCIYRTPNGIMNRRRRTKPVTKFEQIYDNYVKAYTDIKHPEKYAQRILLWSINSMNEPHRKVFNAAYYYERLLYGFMDLCTKQPEWKDKIESKLLHYFRDDELSTFHNQNMKNLFNKFKEEEKSITDTKDTVLYNRLKKELTSEMIKQIKSGKSTFCDCYDLYQSVKNDDRKEALKLKKQIGTLCNKLCF